MVVPPSRGSSQREHVLGSGCRRYWREGGDVDVHGVVVSAALFGGFLGEAAEFFQLVFVLYFGDAAVGVEPQDAGDVELAGLLDEPFGAVAFGDGGGEGEGDGWRRGELRGGLQGGGDFMFVGARCDEGGSKVALAVEEFDGGTGGEAEDGGRRAWIGLRRGGWGSRGWGGL